MCSLLVLTGCRTYGGYGTEDELVNQVAEVVSQFEGDLERAQSEQLRISREAAGRAVLESLAADHAEAVAMHAELLDQQRAYAEALVSEGGSYRVLNRALGALYQEQELVYDRYERLFEEALVVVAGFQTNEPPFSSRWYVVPPQYDRIRRDMEDQSLIPLFN